MALVGDYSKPRSRAEMVAYVPTAARRVLDVGCGPGSFGRSLRSARPDVEIWGVDPRPQLSEPAARCYDRFVQGAFPEAVADDRFDVVVFNDVLEHVVDPWSMLSAWREWLEPRGAIVASIPNIRHITVLYNLAVRGEWRYRDNGLLDRTHLRFFTRSTIGELFDQAGLRIERIDAINTPRSGPLGRVSRVTGDRPRDLLALQFGVVARPA